MMLKKSILVLLCFCSLSAFSLTPIVDSIPMSDGRKLAADIYIPSGMTSGPVILIQTPYNRQISRLAGLPLGIGLNLNSSNYIFVIVDWRGFYGSKNAAYIGSPDRGKDGYTTVEWIAAQNWSDGKVGTWGPSALGKVQYQTAKYNPPHLVCINPLVGAPQFNYSEYYPGGAIRTEYVEQLDQLGYGLSTSLMAHPYKDTYWNFAESTNFYPDSIRIPCFMIGGWYDHNVELMMDFFKAIKSSSVVDVKDKHKIIMGPWVHGGHGTARVGSSNIGELSYPNAVNMNDTFSLRFFDFYLRGINNSWESKPVYTYYQMGENIWTSTQTWPPAGVGTVTFYMQPDGTLNTTLPKNTKDSLSFVYDPNNPSPTIGGCTLRNDLDQGPYDQTTKVESRGDILVFSTPTLTKNVVLKGKVKVKLKVGSDRLDTDFTIRLTDVYPDGKSMLLNDQVFRMRFRNGFALSNVQMMAKGQVYDCVIELPTTCITFLAGHKIRIDVSSANYPKYNRNMNNGNAMYPGNSLDSLLNPLVATNIVYTNLDQASSVELPLVNYNSLTSVFEEQAFDIYPNPASNAIQLSSSNFVVNGSDYTIYDVYGKAVNEGVVDGSIDINTLSSGMYTIVLKTDQGVYSRKFIK